MALSVVCSAPWARDLISRGAFADAAGGAVRLSSIRQRVELKLLAGELLEEVLRRGCTPGHIP
jgi:hypothetical protein